MEWTDDAIVLSVRKHGETSVIVTLMTRGRGRHAGLVRGGAGRRLRGVYQPGNAVHARWRARLAEHLGTLDCELTAAHAAPLLDNPRGLAALSSACSVCEAALPERESHRAVFEGLCILLPAFDKENWPSAYVKWELGLLAELGFGLDLSRCAATGSPDKLAYVSPKSGRAVSLGAGEPYKDKLLILPEFLLIAGGEGDAGDVTAGLKLTGYFLDRYVFGPSGKAQPAARNRLIERLKTLREL